MNSGFWWMVLYLVSTTGIHNSSSELYLITESCPTSSHICTCDLGVLNCTCGVRDHLVIERLNVTDLLGVHITGCQRLTIQPLSFKNFEFEFVYLGDIETLVLDRLAFFASNVDFFEIANIADFRAKHYSMSGMGNVTSVVLRNITADTLPRHFILDVEDLLITDSQIGIVQQYAFMMIQKLSVTNTTLDLVQSLSFFLKNNGKTFLFMNDTVTAIDGLGIQLGPFESVSFVRCNFGELSPVFAVGKRLSHFTFVDNQVQACEVNAFQSLHATESFTFARNQFDLAEIYSLPALYFLPDNTTMENNNFSCDCEISWLWRNQTGEDHDHFMNTNFCSDDTFNVTLDQLDVVFDKDDVCVELVTITTTPAPTKQTTTSTTQKSLTSTKATIPRHNFSDKLQIQSHFLGCVLLLLISWQEHWNHC